GEAESFARILRGLSRSVSADSIVSAILDDLIDATAADHVVLVRRRPEARSLEARLVTRRAGVPTTATMLPVSLLDPVPGDAGASVGVPVGPGRPEDRAEERRPAPIPSLSPEERLRLYAPAVAAASAASAGVVDDVDSDPQETPPGASGQGDGAEQLTLDIETEEAPTASLMPSLPRVARRETDAGGSRTFLRRVAAESLALIQDIGLPAPDLFGARGRARPVEVLARGSEAVLVERLAARVQSVFGLAHTLTSPLRSEGEVIGAIVLSRRSQHAWSESSRRLLRGAAHETAAALVRAESYREATAGAATDPLTGLPNRRYFDEFAGLLAGGRRSGDGVAVLMVDIDKFKGLNDTYGHPVGDQVLRAVAEAITRAVRDQDVPARIGGEEFAVLLRNPGPDVAIEVGERVRNAVRDLDLRTMGVPGVSVSVGVANATAADEPIQAVLDRADQALLRAKRAGRDRVIAG
ncbi:MAG TPA: sensor domain-containing diguanylate cyclase, partial [Patescibacteria group bacterium]|nr:sensor domain-containing diguanylate cyclase [Patescibacteria group bacterium]